MGARRAAYGAHVACVALALSGSAARAEVTAVLADTGVAPTFSFAVWGHPHAQEDGRLPLHGEEVVARIRELGADLLIVTGDAIYNMPGQAKDRARVEAEWDRFEALVEPLDIPYYMVPGNHEVSDPVTRDVFLERFGKRPYYAFSFRGSRFLVLDTVGIDAQTRGPTRCHPERPCDSKQPIFWDYRAIPFDAEQMAFIRSEAASAGDSEHVFVFLHHSELFLKPGSSWWREIHPLFQGGPTRAVFGGDPYEGKYRYVERDGIYYIQSSSRRTRPGAWLRAHPAEAAAQSMQPDNIQLVRVRGPEVAIQTVVVGALTTPGLSQHFWDEVEGGLSTPQRIKRAIERIDSARNLARWLALGAGVCLLAGLGTGLGLAWAWSHTRGRR